MGNYTFGGEIVWEANAEYRDRSNLARFMEIHRIGSFDKLMRRSTDDVPWFTETILRFLEIEFQKPYSKVLDLSRGIQFPRWCVDGELNIAYNCVDKWANNPDTADNRAVIWEGEEGESRTLTYGELRDESNRCANALLELGFEKGDVIGIYMPMTPEIVVALFAVTKIGGIILPLFSGYGPRAVAERLNDAGAKCLFTADGFFRRGKTVSLKEPADKAVEEAKTIWHMIVLRRAGNDITMKPGRDLWWHDLIPRQAPSMEFERTSAEDTLMIIYTSGTSGKPKGTVHTHCGFPVKSAQDMAFGTDVHSGDTIYWITDLGWMMGPWLIFGASILRARCFLYDGAPDFPGPDRLWAMTARHKITVLGVSPTLIRVLIPFGEQPVKKHDLSSLRFFASTSEPWNPDPWMWLFETVGERKRPIINYSGGTEISGGIVMGNPLLPLKATAFSGPCPGIDADVVDENCEPVRNKVGELIIRKPWIGMTRGFWNDDKRYLETYWSRWENIWVHGDWAAIDSDGLWYILGRSDDTIKVAGKRVGPAEVESVLVGHPMVSEAAAIGIPHEVKGSEVVCFCVLNKKDMDTGNLTEQLKSRVANEMGKPLKPKDILFVSDLPKTRNGKIMRRVIKRAFLGEDFGDISSLANPESVEEIKQMRRA